MLLDPPDAYADSGTVFRKCPGNLVMRPQSHHAGSIVELPLSDSFSTHGLFGSDALEHGVRADTGSSSP
jgi:hypothetical protein